MKNLLSIFISVSYYLVSISNIYAYSSDKWEGKGRIAISSDGNHHDTDDWAATAVTLLILAKENLQDKVVLYTFSDHVWGNKTQEHKEQMRLSALGARDIFGYHKTKFIEAVAKPNQAYNAMRDAILASTKDDPLFILAAGTMKVIGKGLEMAYAENPDALKHVSVFSHSEWNNRHPSTHNEPQYNWSAMYKQYKSIVNFVNLPDQNGKRPDAGLHANPRTEAFNARKVDKCLWMKTHKDPAVRWTYDRYSYRAQTNHHYDFSDAGMAFYLVTGNKYGNAANLENYIGTDLLKEPSTIKMDKPNIVVILCDDLGYGDLSSFGHPIIQTKNLDELAENGIKLTNFYSSSPVCSPSRVGLLTGRSPNKAGVYDYIPGTHKTKNARDLVHLQKDEITIPSILKEAGYNTCLSGKWHCNSQFNSVAQPQPNHFGFDHWFATHNNAVPSHENPNNFVRNGEKVGRIEGFSCQIVVNEAINWLKKQENEKPFYLQVNFHEPHEPVASPKDLVKKYLPFSENENQAQYFANVENMDIAVGRLKEYLKEHYGENTLIVFSSDNGPETLNRYPKSKRSYGSSGDLKGMKLWTNEAGIRVPGIVSWLGKDSFQGTSNSVISALDFLPTFSKLAGGNLPRHDIDGESFLSLFETGKFERSKPLIWCFYNALNSQVVAMRLGDWKIMCRLKSGLTDLPKIANISNENETLVKEAELTDFVLFNMKDDKEEKIDLSAKELEVFEKMQQRMKLEYKKLLDNSFIWKRD